MTFDAAKKDCPPQMRDREVIRVDFNTDKFGITAALRQAFNSAATDPSDSDFEKLLAGLN